MVACRGRQDEVRTIGLNMTVYYKSHQSGEMRQQSAGRLSFMSRGGGTNRYIMMKHFVM